MQALVDAPSETRKVIGFKRLQLTDLKVEIPRLASKKVLVEAFNSAGAKCNRPSASNRCISGLDCSRLECSTGSCRGVGSSNSVLVSSSTSLVL